MLFTPSAIPPAKRLILVLLKKARALGAGGENRLSKVGVHDPSGVRP